MQINELSNGEFSNTKIGRIKYKQSKRRLLLAQQFGLSDASKLRVLVGRPCLFEDEVASRKRLIYPKCPRLRRPGMVRQRSKSSEEDPLEGGFTLNEVAYTDSTTFLKGTQSANPHNDYCQHFVDTGGRPQNFIRDTGLKNRFEEYPKLRELIRLKDEIIAKTATPPMYLKTDLETFNLRDLQCKFDVILIEPPLEEYNRSHGAVYDRYWTWDEIERLEVEQIAAQRSFVWIWCGSGEGLDRARRCLRKWGYRRCEDICWIKTNKSRPGHKNLLPGAILQRTKEHCLMGIKGTVRRSTDGDFIHANVDIDLMIEEEQEPGSKEKPIEMFHLIEHFCLGRRRLHLFGRDSTIRQGWLSVGSELTMSNFDSRIYSGYFTKDPSGNLTGSSEEIERLRPKSPPPRQKPGQTSNQQGPSGTGTLGTSAQSQGTSAGPPQGMTSMGSAGGSLLGTPNVSASGFPSTMGLSGGAMPPTLMGFNHPGNAMAAFNAAKQQAMLMQALSMFNPYGGLLPHPGAHDFLGGSMLDHGAAAFWGANAGWMNPGLPGSSSNSPSQRSSSRQSSRRDWQR